MINDKKNSKSIIVVALVCTSLSFFSCENKVNQENTISKTNSGMPTVVTERDVIKSTLSKTIDWTSNKIYSESDKKFNTKSSADYLKPDLSKNQNYVDTSKVISGSTATLSGLISTTAGSTVIYGNQSDFTVELKAGDKILIEKTGEILEVASVPPTPTPTPSGVVLTFGSPSPGPLTPIINVKTASTKTIANSKYRIYINKNSRAKAFGSVNVYPAIDLNGVGTADDVLYFTSDNKTGANFFAMGSDGRTVWEHGFVGTFDKASPTFSQPNLLGQQKLYLGKKLMYVVSKEGNLYCVNTDGLQVAQLKIQDNFMNSVWVDSSDANIDYIYASSTNGNLYKLKMDLTNTQQANFTLEYSKKIDSTSFFSSPVVNGSSLYLGGENGTFYEIITSTGDISKTVDLSAYTKNGSAKITATPVVGLGGAILVPAGGYLFRIVGSNVAQSPLLELKYDQNSRNKAYGAVFPSSNVPNPTGNINDSAVVNGNLAYISNGNTIFEMDYSSSATFSGKANYCVSASGRLDDTGSNLTPGSTNNIALSFNTSGIGRIAMSDFNMRSNSAPYVNFFSIPFASDVDSLTRYGYFNEFDSTGHSVSNLFSTSISDGAGNVYFTLNNGSVNSIATP